ncbi:MAG: hypothetical protein S4CHLAM2_08820 [Chlamydiales bacterium]|nr:hypothetical protein [Chlamydiales bacterium]
MKKLSLFLLTLTIVPTSLYSAFVIETGQIETVTQFLTAAEGDTGIVETGGVLITSDGSNAVEIGGVSQFVFNKGTIETTAGGTLINFSVAGYNGGTIINNGLMLTQNLGNIVDIETAVDGTRIINNNLMSTVANGSSLIVGFQSTNTFFQNNGIMSSRGAGARVFDMTQGEGSIFQNYGSIFTEGAAGIGVALLDHPNSVVLNAGLISTAAVVADGVEFRRSGATSLTNTGRIQTDGSSSHGVSVEDSASVSIDNSGSITAAGPDSRGVYYSNSETPTFINTGSIITTGTGSSRAVELFDSAGAVVRNGGLIASANEDGVSFTASSSDGHLINGGTIKGGAGFSAIVYTDSSTNPTLTLLRGSNIQGSVNSFTDPINLNVESGLNLLLTLSNGSLGSLGIEAPFAVVNDNTVAVIDRAGFALQADVLADLSDTILGGIYRNKTTDPCYPCCTSDFSMWMEGIGSYRKRGINNGVVGYKNRQGGIVLGANTTVCSGCGSAFLGFMRGRAEVDRNTQNACLDTFFGGAAYETYICGTFMGLAIAGGYIHWENTRYVMNNLANGGLEAAQAQTSAGFVSPEFTLARAYSCFSVPLALSGTVRYAGLFLGHYTETDSSANLSVQDRDIHLITARAELGAPVTNCNNVCEWVLEPYIGVFARFQFGDDVHTALLGQSLAFDPGLEQTLGGLLLGFRATQAVGRFNLFLNVESSFDSENSSRILGEGGISLSF